MPQQPQIGQDVSHLMPQVGEDVSALMGGPQQITEPTTYAGGFLRSLGDTAAQTGKGIVRGALNAVNPVSLVKGAVQAADLFSQPWKIPQMAGGVVDQGRKILSGDPSAGGEAIGNLAMGGIVGPRIMSAASQIPAGRIANAGMAGLKAGAEKIPIVGPPMKAGFNAAREAWSASGPEQASNATLTIREPPPPPAMTPEPVGPMQGPQGKPKLSAPEVAQRLREEYGSQKAGSMLYGTKHAQGLPPAERAAAIKRLAPGESQLPNVAKQAIASKYGDFQKYLASAPNERAREFILQLMKDQ